MIVFNVSKRLILRVIMLIILVYLLSIITAKYMWVRLVERGFAFVFDGKNIEQYSGDCIDISPFPNFDRVPDSYDQRVVSYMIDLQNRYYMYLDNPSKLHVLSERSDIILASIIHTKTSKKPAALVLFEASSNSSFVLFRGTDGAKEWGMDLNVNACTILDQGETKEKPRKNEVLIHAGFHAHYKNFRDQLLSSIKNLNSGNIYIFGHSLGAASANLLLYDLLSRSKLYTSEHVYAVTIGAPRVGNPEFCEELRNLGGKLFRISNLADAVCTVPLSYMPALDVWGLAMRSAQTYRHAGVGYIFSKAGANLMDNHSLPTYKRAIKTKTLVCIEDD